MLIKEKKIYPAIDMDGVVNLMTILYSTPENAKSAIVNFENKIGYPFNDKTDADEIRRELNNLLEYANPDSKIEELITYLIENADLERIRLVSDGSYLNNRIYFRISKDGDAFLYTECFEYTYNLYNNSFLKDQDIISFNKKEELFEDPINRIQFIFDHFDTVFLQIAYEYSV